MIVLEGELQAPHNQRGMSKMGLQGGWKRITTLDTKFRNGVLAVKLGADNPADLDIEEAFQAAKAVAKRKGFTKAHGKTTVKTFGQNRLAERVFYYTKGGR